MILQDYLIALSHLSVYYTWRNFRDVYGNTEFSYKHLPSGVVVSGSLPDGSYDVKDISNFIHYKMDGAGHGNSDGSYDINLYVNAVYNRITVDVGSDFELTLSRGMGETLGFDVGELVLSGVTKNGSLVPRIEKVNTVLVHCNLVKNRADSDSSVVYSFVPNKSFSSLLEVKPNFGLFRRCRNASFDYIEVWLTNQDGEELDVEDDWLVEIIIKEI